MVRSGTVVAAGAGGATGAGSSFFVGLTSTFRGAACINGSATAAAPDGNIVTSAAITIMPPRNPIAAANTIHDAAGRGRVAVFHSVNSTLVPLPTIAASFNASQFVRRTQPCDEVWPTVPGSGVPWIP